MSKEEYEVLKQCPFCGATPVVDCDITDWRGYPVYGEKENEYRPVYYRLYASHKEGCFIRRMEGLNVTGRMSTLDFEQLVSVWNRRAGK